MFALHILCFESVPLHFELVHEFEFDVQQLGLHFEEQIIYGIKHLLAPIWIERLFHSP